MVAYIREPVDKAEVECYVRVINFLLLFIILLNYYYC